MSTVALADLFPDDVDHGELKTGSYQLVVKFGDHVLASEQIVVGQGPGAMQ